MKRFLPLLLMGGSALAQTTQTYTGVIKDLTQQVVTSGQVTFTLTLPNASTIPGVGTFVPTTTLCNINTDGTLSGFIGGSVSGACTVTANISLTPTGTAYRICEQPYFTTPGSCFFDYALGGTKDISSIVPTLPTGPINYGGVQGPPIPFLGLWSSTTVYTLGQAVSFANAVYISLTNPNLNNNPSSSTANWSVVLQPASLLSLPGATQTVTQPTGTTFAVNSLNGVLNAAVFAGADIGAKVNAAFASCSSTCLVTIPPGAYAYTTTIVMNKPTQSLIGSGSAFTTLNYTGSGDAVLWQMNPFTVKKAGTLKGLTFVCTVSATNCIHSGSVQGSTWEDLVVQGATGASASGILLENKFIAGVTAWTERTMMHNVQIGSSGVGNTNGLDFRINGGTDSFGYGDYDLWFNIQPGQVGINVETGASPYHSTMTAKGNIDAEPATFIKVAGPMLNGSVFIFAETTGNTLSAVANDIVVTATGSIVATGNIAISTSIGGNPNNSLAVPNVATGGIYRVSAFTDLNYPGGSNFAASQNNVIEKAAQAVSADGTVQIASGASALVGRFIIEWPSASSRYDAMTVDVACTAFEGQACLLSSSNYAFGAATVLSNPRIFRDSAGAVPYLTVDVANRNGVTQNLIVTWMGSAANSPNLFPSGTLGASAQPTYGYSFGQGGSNVVQSGATAPTGTCTPNGFIPVVVNNVTLHLATCP